MLTLLEMPAHGLPDWPQMLLNSLPKLLGSRLFCGTHDRLATMQLHVSLLGVGGRLLDATQSLERPGQAAGLLVGL